MGRSRVADPPLTDNSEKRATHEDNARQPHPPRGPLRPVGRGLLRPRWTVPSTERGRVRHQHPLGNRARSCLRHVVLRRARAGGPLCPASRQDWLARFRRFRPAQPLDGAHHGLQLRRSLHAAAARDHAPGVRGGVDGNVHRRRHQVRPGVPPHAVDPDRTHLHARWPAVRHRDVPGRHPAPMGRRIARRRHPVGAPGRPAPQRGPAEDRDPGGVGLGLARVRALVATTAPRGKPCGAARPSERREHDGRQSPGRSSHRRISLVAGVALPVHVRLHPHARSLRPRQGCALRPRTGAGHHRRHRRYCSRSSWPSPASVPPSSCSRC